jgi:ribosome-associated translation inhibitor RaiA
VQVPLSVSFKGVPVSEALREVCWTEAQKLEDYYDRITSCHVTVSLPLRHRKGNHFAIGVRLAVPGGNVVVSRTPTAHATDENPNLAIHDAFREARRQLQEHAQRLRGETKQHGAPGA